MFGIGVNCLDYIAAPYSAWKFSSNRQDRVSIDFVIAALIVLFTIALALFPLFKTSEVEVRTH